LTGLAICSHNCSQLDLLRERSRQRKTELWRVRLPFGSQLLGMISLISRAPPLTHWQWRAIASRFDWYLAEDLSLASQLTLNRHGLGESVCPSPTLRMPSAAPGRCGLRFCINPIRDGNIEPLTPKALSRIIHEPSSFWM
jgi:hypothetical protein